MELKDLKTVDIASHSRKKGRYYHRLSSGLTFAKYKKQRVRFMTLTTSDKGKFLDISRDFDVFVKRIRRKYPSFNYCKVNTNEGNGVIHLLYIGSYMPKKWIVANWNSIHHSYVVDIQEIRNQGKLVNYLVTHYLSNQKCSYTRMSWSQGWLFRGAISRWKAIVKAVKNGYFYNDIHNKYYKNKEEVPFKVLLDKMLSIWNEYLYYHSFTQLKITSY